MFCEKIFFTLLKPIDMRWDGGGVKYLDILSMIFIVKNKN
jgi:hypothetical protein